MSEPLPQNQPKSRPTMNRGPLAYPHPVGDDQARGRIPADIHKYFFRQVLPGDRGVMQALICHFFHALHNECKRQGIPAQWEPTNEQRIADVIKGINFDPTTIASLLAKFPDGFYVDRNGGVVERKRSSRPGRADQGTPVAAPQPAGQEHDSRTADSDGQ